MDFTVRMEVVLGSEKNEDAFSMEIFGDLEARVKTTTGYLKPDVFFRSERF